MPALKVNVVETRLILSALENGHYKRLIHRIHTSYCVACHTKEPAKIHMDTMTNLNGQEACVTCHGVGRAFAVEKVHQR